MLNLTLLPTYNVIVSEFCKLASFVQPQIRIGSRHMYSWVNLGEVYI